MFILKIFSGLFTTFIMAIILSTIAYTPYSERLANTHYTSFSGLLFLHILFIGPVFIFAVIPSAYAIDKINKLYLKNSYLKNLTIYGIASLFIGIVYSTFIFKEDFHLAMFLITSILGMLCYFNIQWFLKKYSKKRYF